MTARRFAGTVVPFPVAWGRFRKYRSARALAQRTYDQTGYDRGGYPGEQAGTSLSVQVVVVRKARQDDLSGIAKVRVDTWRDAYAGFIPDDFLAGLSYEATADGWLMLFFENRAPAVEVFVAETEGKEIVGVAVCGPEREQDPVYQGEVYVLYVLPEYQNQGIGRRLVAACVQHLIKQLSAKTMLIWAFAENPYRRFYEMLGGRAVREKSKEIGGKTYLEAGYGWEDIHALAG